MNPPTTVSSFHSARRDLFEAFDAEPFDAAMRRCGHCVSDDEVAALGAPVAAIDPELLGRFVVKAGTTWGGPHDLRRVAPRALMLAADGRLPVSRGLLWEKLGWAGWPTWPADQATAVHRFLLAEWTRLLGATPRPAHSAHGWLRQVACATGDLTPFLAAWNESISPIAKAPRRRAAILHLTALLVDSELRPDFPGTVATVLGDDPGAAEQLTGWLTGADTERELRRAAEALAHTRDARRVEVAAERLRRFHAATHRRAVHAR